MFSSSAARALAATSPPGSPLSIFQGRQGRQRRAAAAAASAASFGSGSPNPLATARRSSSRAAAAKKIDYALRDYDKKHDESEFGDPEALANPMKDAVADDCDDDDFVGRPLSPDVKLDIDSDEEEAPKKRASTGKTSAAPVKKGKKEKSEAEKAAEHANRSSAAAARVAAGRGGMISDTLAWNEERGGSTSDLIEYVAMAAEDGKWGPTENGINPNTGKVDEFFINSHHLPEFASNLFLERKKHGRQDEEWVEASYLLSMFRGSCGNSGDYISFRIVPETDVNANRKGFKKGPVGPRACFPDEECEETGHGYRLVFRRLHGR